MCGRIDSLCRGNGPGLFGGSRRPRAGQQRHDGRTTSGALPFGPRIRTQVLGVPSHHKSRHTNGKGHRQTGSKIQIAGWSSYSVLLWSLKASLLVFYLRLTNGLGRSYRIRIYIGFGLLLSSFSVVILNLYLACRPFHRNWQISPDPGDVCQPAIASQIVWTYFAMNVTTDLYLISIPVPMLFQANLKLLRKLGLMVLFSGGLFVVACATLRCVLIVTDPVNGAQLAGSWAVRESFIAVVTTNLPMIFPLLKVWLGPLVGSLMSSLTGGTTTRSKGGLTGASGTTDRNTNRTFGGGGTNHSSTWGGRRGGGPPVNPLTNITFTESEEAIVGKAGSGQLDDGTESSSGDGSVVKMQDMNKLTRSNSKGNGNGNQNNNIRKDVQVTVSVTVSEDSEDPASQQGQQQPPRKSLTGRRSEDQQHQQPHPRHDPLHVVPPAKHGSSYAFARGPSSRNRDSFHFGNV